MTRRYAEDTKVTIGQSIEQVKGALRKAGADQLAVYEAADKSAVAFRIAGRMYRIDVPMKDGRDAAQEAKRSWRLLLLLIKAKLEAVREGATTVEREFLADALMPDGSTVGDWAGAQLTIAYQTGKMPTQLLLGAPNDPSQ